MTEFILADFADRPIKLGTTVRIWWDPKMEVQEGDGDFGVVTDLGEWDGDVDEEGRSIGVAPYVTVVFESGITASFWTSEWEYESGYDSDGYCREPVSGRVEELDVVQGPLRKEVLV